MDIIKVENVSKTYSLSKKMNLPVLSDVNLSVEQGSIVTIYGVSGSGKTTLLNLIGCLDIPTSGRIFIEGQDVSLMNDKEKSCFRNAKIGFVFQEFYLIPYRTAYDNCMVPLYFAHKDAKRKEKNIESVLDRLGIGDLKNRKVAEMSGGQKQRVAIARAIINENPIIIADEPTGQLDSHQRDEIALIFKSLRNECKTIIISTHDERLAVISDRIVHIEDGRIIEQRD